MLGARRSDGPLAHPHLLPCHHGHQVPTAGFLVQCNLSGSLEPRAWPFGSLAALGGASLGASAAGPGGPRAPARLASLCPPAFILMLVLGASHAPKPVLCPAAATPAGPLWVARWEPVGRRGRLCRLCHCVLLRLAGTDTQPSLCRGAGAPEKAHQPAAGPKRGQGAASETHPVPLGTVCSADATCSRRPELPRPGRQSLRGENPHRAPALDQLLLGMGLPAEASGAHGHLGRPCQGPGPGHRDRVVALTCM